MQSHTSGGKEVTFSEKNILLSTTDTDSYITYANDDFCEIAGFSLDEMTGKPHNLVRHQDMPKLAFADMWKTLKSGESWMGPVKNRCKNGDFYWVNAFVTPIRNNDGDVVEYQSVRTKPSTELVNRASKEYKKINSGVKTKSLNKAKDRTLLSLCGFIMALLFGLTALFTTDFDPLVTILCLILFVTTVLFAQWRKQYLEVVNKSKRIYDNSMMAYLYSGTNDLTGQLNLALEMQRAKIRAVVGRVNDVTEKVNKNATESSDCGKHVAMLLDRQTGEVTQMATAMDQFSATIRELASNVNEAATAAAGSESQTTSGKNGSSGNRRFN